MKIEGTCHCGLITYEAEIDPATVTMCHCPDCQMLSGSAFRTLVPARKEVFKLITGAPKIYLKTTGCGTESGNRSVQSFCDKCGAAIYSSAEINPEIFMLRVGTIRQRAELNPKSQMYCQSALIWLSEAWPLKKFARLPTI
jgi:hypothetical protein